MENKVKVSIFGNEYSIMGDADQEYILKIAQYVNDRMQDISKNISSGNKVQIAILTALNIADEYFQLREMKSDISGEMEKKTKALISMLEEGLVGDIFSAAENKS